MTLTSTKSETQKRIREHMGDDSLHDSIAVLDFGSQYSQLIARCIRELNTYSELLPCTTSAADLKRLNPRGIILSGGPSSVYEPHAPKCDPEIWKLGIPVLGVCYGMQLMAQDLGGVVEAAEVREYGRATLTVVHHGSLFAGMDPAIESWMSHGDSVVELPEGFAVVARTLATPVAAIADEKRSFFGVQFHPEVAHTRGGQHLLKNFVVNVCRCTQSWSMREFVDYAIEDVRNKVQGKRVLLALSGGVDSSTLAFLLHKAIGDNLTCMFIDQGFMRKNEPEWLVDIFENKFKIHVHFVKARDRFLKKIEGVTDPEVKRKRIGEEFIRVFEEESQTARSVRLPCSGHALPRCDRIGRYQGRSQDR